MTPDEQHLFDRFGWLPDPDQVARLDAEHAAAVARAQPPVRHIGPVIVNPVVILGPWSRGNGHNVAHRFRENDHRSLCGLTDSRPHRDTQPAPAAPRCTPCEARLRRAQERAA